MTTEADVDCMLVPTGAGMTSNGSTTEMNATLWRADTGGWRASIADDELTVKGSAIYVCEYQLHLLPA